MGSRMVGHLLEAKLYSFVMYMEAGRNRNDVHYTIVKTKQIFKITEEAP